MQGRTGARRSGREFLLLAATVTTMATGCGSPKPPPNMPPPEYEEAPLPPGPDAGGPTASLLSRE